MKKPGAAAAAAALTDGIVAVGPTAAAAAAPDAIGGILPNPVEDGKTVCDAAATSARGRG